MKVNLVALILHAFLFCLLTAKTWSQTVSEQSDIGALQIRAQEFYDRANYQSAITAWEQLSITVESEDSTLYVETQLKIAQAFLRLGLYREALATISSAEAAVKSLNSTDATIRWLNVRANAETAYGTTNQARSDLEQAIKIASQQQILDVLPYLYNDYGNTLQIAGLLTEAKESYLNALQLVENNQWALHAKISLNLSRLANVQNELDESETYLIQTSTSIESLSNKALQAQLLLNVSDIAGQLRAKRESIKLFELTHAWLTRGLELEAELNDKRLISNLYGYLAQLYFQSEQNNEADRLLGLALENAQLSQADDLAYLWQWQRAKVMEQKGNVAEALASYETAIQTLSHIRFQLSKGYFSDDLFFEEKIKSLYTDYVDLLFKQANEQPKAEAKSGLLLEARATIENLKSAELEDYYQDRCTVEQQEQQVNLEKVAANAAVLYPVVLPDRLELLLSAQDKIFQFTVDVSEEIFVQNAKQFQTLVQNKQDARYLPYSQRLFKWLIAPIVPELEQANITTLVIVPDTEIFGLPFSALHDENGFLIEKVGLAVTPSLSLTAPEHINLSNTKALVGGMSSGINDLSPLINADREMLEVKNLLAGQLLQNGNYTSSNLYNSLRENDFSIVHLATHGSFGNSVDQSFLATYDGEMNFSELQDLVQVSRFRKTPVELLTLSACETASGSKKAALGLAGIAIKSGARSALASLWVVDDAATADLMTAFYQGLVEDELSKASALRLAQLQLLRQASTAHPAYWAPFVLIGNWL